MSVAVVILNWNGRHYLEKFVPVILERTRIARQASALGSASDYKEAAAIFVADNGSTDGSVEWLEWAYPSHEVNVLRFDKNYGFTGGYNKAFEQIRRQGGNFKYYLLLNSDIEVTDGWLETLVQFMDTHAACAISSPKILSYGNREYFEHAGACGGYVDHFYFPYCRGRVLATIEKDMGQYDNPCKVFWASGAAFLIRASVWHNLGGLDDSFFAHMEEIDLCWRAQAAGWEVWSVPMSSVYHVGGGTLPNNSPRKLYLNFRNNLLMMYKNLPVKGKRRIIFARMVADGLIGCIYLVTGKISFFKSVIRAHKDYREMKKDAVLTEGAGNVSRPKPWLAWIVLKMKFARNI